MSEKLCSMSAREAIAEIAGAREWGDTRESWLARVSRRVPSVPYRTVRSLWYGEIDDPKHWAARELRREVARRRTAKEIADHAATMKQRAEALRATDTDFFDAEISRLEQLVARLGDLDFTEG